MKASYLFLLFLFCGVTAAQEVQINDSLYFSKKELPAAEIMRRDIYVPGTLWGYIDGGADIYFEYGFEKAIVEDVKIQGMTFKSEIYQMTDNSSAYGIFSISKSKCRERDSSEDHSCITNYQVQYARNKFYISIINETGTAEAKKLSKELAGSILKKLPTNNYKLPDLFFTKKIVSFKENVRLIQGPLGIQNTLPELEDMFQGLSNYEVYYLPIDTHIGSLGIYYTVFREGDDLKRFVSNIKSFVKTESKARSSELKFYDLNEHTILFTESNLSTDFYNSYISSFNLPLK